MTDDRNSIGQQGLDRDSIEVFNAQAHTLLDFHWRRSDGFERKGATILAASAASLALLLNVARALPETAPNGHALSLALLILGASVALLFSGSFAAWTLKPRHVKLPPLGELQDEWRAYDQGHRRQATELLSLFTDSLIGLKGKEHAIESYESDADERSKYLKRSILALTTAVALLVLAVILELVRGMIASG